MGNFSVQTLLLILIVCVITSWAQDISFPEGPAVLTIPDVGATDSPQYYADANLMIDVDGSDIPDDLLL
ncbi:hypothetical protein Bhyg_07224 [Pseudolycoriella hygida]|uniref:Uncharacterized protein n=1 Tax=Pseudolycoriella hygida TaxID=35572 RepID=A0A9Q0N2A2_9DIPT|nr:hypothetical protein Bhyg_07224 [Pseudolycoriella hygida]